MNKTITFGEALMHCLSTASYDIWLAVGVVLFLDSIILAIKVMDKGRVVAIGIGLAILMVTFFYRPAEVAANTTEEQAARGVYIGY